MDYLSLILLYKNDAHYIKEWIEFHKLIGVNRFYIYNNNSSDNHVEVLKPYINDGTVVYHDYNIDTTLLKPWEHLGQVEHFIKNYGHKTHWAASIDIDEFLFPINGMQISNTLEKYKSYDGIYVYWKNFNSNGHLNEPSGLVLENYTETCPMFKTNLGKTIFKPSKCMKYQASDWPIKRHSINAHLIALDNLVDENKTKIVKDRLHDTSVPSAKRTYVNFQINHYYHKSKFYFLNKKSREKVDDKVLLYRERVWRNGNNNKNTSIDKSIEKYVPELKKRVK